MYEVLVVVDASVDVVVAGGEMLVDVVAVVVGVKTLFKALHPSDTVFRVLVADEIVVVSVLGVALVVAKVDALWQRLVVLS